MKRLLLDSNFVVYLFKYKKLDILFDLSLSYRILLLDRVLMELKKILKDKYDFILKFLKSVNASVVRTKSKGYTDKILLNYAKKQKCILATNDKELKRKAKVEGVIVMSVRNKSTVIID